MERAADDAAGFSLVETVVAMLLMAVVAMSIMVGLSHGILHSSKQASTATATRFLSSLVEEARGMSDCTGIASVIGRAVSDGKGATMTSAGSVSSDCASGVAATLTLSIVQAGETLAATTARIHVP